MNQAQRAVVELRAMDELAAGSSPMHRLSAGSKLALTLCYLLLVVSYHKYEGFALLWMVLFPLVGYQCALLSVRTCFVKLRMVLPLVCAVGVLNPLFDREVLFSLGGIAVTGGVLSMLTLMLKGIFTLMASFLLMATTPIEALCGALRAIHVPRFLVSLLLLTFRYLTVLLEEVAVMTDAYHLRAPRQKGIDISAWGSFVGQLLLRSMDRAERLYQSMVLRGFQGDLPQTSGESSSKWSGAVAVLGMSLMVLVRLHPWQ